VLEEDRVGHQELVEFNGFGNSLAVSKGFSYF
jgi:hypothetical protein